MGNPDPVANAIKELTKEIKKQNKLLENLTEAIEKGNCNYIYKITPTYAPTPIDPLNPYQVTCDNTSSANPPYYGAKVDTTGYASFGAEWTNKDSLEALN